MKEKIKNQKEFIQITIIIAIAVLGLILYSDYFSKSSGHSQDLQQPQWSVSQKQTTDGSLETKLNDLENRISYLEIALIDLDEKLKKSIEINIEHLKKSQNLQKQVNMLEFTQVRQDININHLSHNCTSVAIEFLSERIERLQESGVYPTDTMSGLENLFEAYVQECR